MFSFVFRQILLVLSLSTSSLLLAADATDRLLPGSVANSLKLDWRQDGKVVEITIQNPSEKWLITEIEFYLTFRRDEPPAAKPTPKPSKKRFTSNDTYGSIDINEIDWSGLNTGSPLKDNKVKLHLMPGKKKSTHLELDYAENVTQVSVSNARGREPTLFEKTRSILP